MWEFIVNSFRQVRVGTSGESLCMCLGGGGYDTSHKLVVSVPTDGMTNTISILNLTLECYTTAMVSYSLELH